MPKSIPLAQSDYRRTVAQEAGVLLRNRFIEGNPVLSDNNVPAYIQRPGLRFWQHIGSEGVEKVGPNRAVYSAPGTFDDDLFVVSNESLFRVHRADGTFGLIATGLDGAEINAGVRMAATGDIGTIPPRLWIADGSVLRVYTENGFAQGQLTGTAIVANDVVVLGTIYYKFTSGSVDAGTPAGTSGSPWLVKLGASLAVSYTNLYLAINDTGVSGTHYSTLLVENPDARAQSATLTDGVLVRATDEGVSGNTVVTTTTAADVAWINGGTLTGGGSAGIILVPIPDDVGVLDVAVINNFVIIIPAQGEGINGRFYWANPGEVTVDPLDFATAERSPDPIYQVIVFNDQFWLPGQSTTEVYYMSGDPDAPVTRFQGVVFDRGTISGTAIQIKDFMVMIDNDGGVFKIQGGETRISTPDIAERLRKALTAESIILP